MLLLTLPLITCVTLFRDIIREEMPSSTFCRSCLVNLLYYMHATTMNADGKDIKCGIIVYSWIPKRFDENVVLIKLFDQYLGTYQKKWQGIGLCAFSLIGRVSQHHTRPLWNKSKSKSQETWLAQQQSYFGFASSFIKSRKTQWRKCLLTV